MSKLVLFFFNELESVHLKKDVGLYPIYLQKYFDKVEIKYFAEKDIVSKQIMSERGIDISPVKNVVKYKASKWQDLTFIFKILNYLKNNDDVTHVMIFHCCYSHLLLINMIKKYFNYIKIYLKLDMSRDSVKDFIKHNTQAKDIKSRLLFPLVSKALKQLDLVTIETLDALNVIKDNSLFNDNVYYSPNGYDDILLNNVSVEKKQKIIITVGRLGTEPKNTELLINIIKKLNLREWRVVLIGPVESSLNKNIDELYTAFPYLKDKVSFVGNVSNPQELVQYYQNASIFAFTSRHEGAPLVLVEASLNGCYICSTDVGSIREFSGENDYCFICPDSKTGNQNEESMLIYFTEKLQYLIDNPESCYEKFDERVSYYKNNYLMSNIIDKQFFKEWAK